MSSQPLRFPSSGDPLVSFVIPTMRRADTLGAAVAALAREARGEIPCELVIVLDSATPEVRGIVAAVPGVVVVAPSVHVGVSGGFALGCDASSGSVLFLVHDDAILQPGCLERLLTSLLDNPQAGVVGPSTQVKGGSVGAVVWQDGRTSHVPDHLAPPEPFPVDAVGTRSLMIRASTYNSIDGFDHRFFPAGYVDVDLCTQVRAAGEAVLAVPAASMYHDSESTSSLSSRSFHAARNHPRYAAKWASTLAAHVPLDLEHLDDAITRALARSRREAEANAGRPTRRPRAAAPLDRSALERRCLEEDLAYHRDLVAHLEKQLVE